MKFSKLQNIRIEDKTVFTFLWFAIFLYPLLFIWQCGDLTDTGVFALHYQTFFDNLMLGKTNSESFLSDLIGATWFRLFPNLGIIGLKFLYLIFLYSVIILIYLILKDISKNKLLLLSGIFCGIVFSERWTPFIFSRDISSWFFLVLLCYFFLIGLYPKKSLYIYYSGLIFALACLSRLPNIVLITILPLVLLYKSLYRERKISLNHFFNIFKEYFIFISGFASMLILFFIILNYFSLNQTFLSNLGVFLTPNQNSYSFVNLLESYIKECVVFLPHALIAASLMLTTSLIYNYSKISKKKLVFIIYIVLLICAVFLIYRGFSYSSAAKYFAPAICLPPLIISLIKKDKFGIIALVILTMAITQVAGSNTGLFLKLCFGFMVLLPLALIMISEEKYITYKNITVDTKVVYISGVSLIMFISIFARIGWIYNVDEGISCRLRAIYPIENNLMKGIFTTNNNAFYIKELCSAIENNIKEDNTLIIYGHQPMFYYLTKHQPPVYKFWLSNNYVQADEFFFSIKESIKLTGKWPMIVDTKQRIMGESGENILSEFLRDNSYVRIEESKDFNIWNKIQK